MSVFLLLTNYKFKRNPEVHLKIQKSNLKFEIHVKIQWISKSPTPSMCGELPSKSQNYGVRYLEVISLTVL